MSCLSKISIVIPTYNNGRYINKAIKSCLNQIGNGVPKVYVVDDGSSDNTYDTIKNIDEIIVIRQPNLGQASAINEALKHITTKYVALLDSDDIFCNDKLFIQLKAMEENPTAVLSYCDRWEINEDDVVVGEIKSAHHDKLKILQRNYIPRSSVLIKKEVLDNFDTKISGNDDWDMWIKLSELGSFIYIEKKLLKYRIHSSNTSITRKRRLHNIRCARLHMLKKCIQRNGINFTYGILIFRAYIFLLLGSNKVLGEYSPRFWNMFDRVFAFIERSIIAVFVFFSKTLKKV